MKIKDSFLVFLVQGYERQLDDGTIIDTITYEVIAETEKDAIEKAKKIIKKPYYRVSQVIEKEIL